MSNVLLNIEDDDFQKDVLDSSIPVLVDFWAPWCGPCRAVAPALEEIANEMQGKVKIAKINVDENQENAGKYGVRSIPNMILFKGGKQVDALIGGYPKEAIKEFLEKNI